MIAFRRVAPLFFLSGMTALLYQVAFGKTLATIFGATAYAVSAVLAAFMGGLALGSHLGGRIARRVRYPLRIYGGAEIAVGLVCAATPSMFHLIAASYVAAVHALPGSLAAVSALRALLTTVVVAVPTVAMGVTFPVLARAVAGGQSAEGAGDGAGGAAESARRRLAWLYSANTAGGACGALLAAYAVLPMLGIATTMRSAAAVNLMIGVTALGLGQLAARAADNGSQPRAVESSSGANDAAAGASANAGLAARAPTLLAALAFASGLLVFAAEVVDTHLLTLLIGNSAYAFGLMLAVFLTCLALGAGLSSGLERRLMAAALPASLLSTGLLLLLTLPIWGELPRAFLALGHWANSWGRRELVRAVVALGALALPTTGMGLTFPLLLRRVAATGQVGARVGRLTALNTAGSILGSLLTGYFVLPALGSESSLRVVGLCFVLLGGATALVELGRHRHRLLLPLGATVLALAASWWLPRWDMKTMTNGANVYFDTQPPPDELLFVAEDVHSGLTSVARRGRVRTLYTNGKFQGDNGSEVTAQRSFAHFPAMFVHHFERALVVGLGTGTTLGTIAAYPFKHLDVAEISPAIIQAASRYFAGPNLGSLRDPRVRLILEDGRNVLLVSQRRYDMVTIELTSVWFAGAANLYSAEFYRLCRQRLQPAGVLQQWVQLHHIRPREVAVVLRSLRAAFEHVALFVSGGQGILVASAQPLTVRPEHLAELEARPAVRATLGPGGRLEGLLDRLMLSGAELDRFITDQAAAGGPLLSTDDNLYLEHATPKGNVMGYHASLKAMVTLLASYRSADQLSRHLLAAAR